MPAAGCAASIHILPGDVVSKIAAGEVIERPAAVVKELIENSLDAGSRQISIDVKDGGLSLIRVTDDGEGIGRIDLPLAFERHATSKLKSDQDLASVRTMGFRGEALPSIASISKIDVMTSTRRDTIGARLTLVGGVTGSLADAPPVSGTKIEVSDLFYNQPARKKFLKTKVTEFSHISHAVQQAALAWPSVHFRLTHNGQEMFNYPSVASDRDRILQVYRQIFIDRTVEVRGRVPGCAIHGVVISPVHARSSRTPQDLFVNRRPVKSAAVFHAITEGYGSFLAKGSHPIFVLFLEIDPDRIDVNVHPAKREIRFAETEPIHQLVRQTVRHAFSGPERNLMREEQAAEKAPETGFFRSHGPATQATSGAERPPVAIPASGSAVSGSITEAQLTLAGEAAGSYADPSTPEIIPFGQILRRYLVAQVGQELQVIDQHTAHERVLFQRLRRSWENREIASQPLLIPEPIELSAAQCMLLQRHAKDLETFGLIVEPFGQGAMAIRAVPVGMGKMDAGPLLQDLLEDLAQWDRASSVDDRTSPVLASLACHSAVRAGRPMALPEIGQLMHDWVEEGLIMTCPHGRRTAFRLSTDELDKLFGRVGWA